MRFIHVSDVHLGMVPDKGKPWSDIRAKEIDTSSGLIQSFYRLTNSAMHILRI